MKHLKNNENCKCALVYLTHFSSEKLEQSLRSFSRVSFFSGIDAIIIIDNSESENELEIIDKITKDYLGINGLKIIIKAVKNNGYAAGNNIGVSLARQLECKYALIINPDIYNIKKSCFESMLKCIQNKDACIVFPRIIDPEGTDYRNAQGPFIRMDYFNVIIRFIFYPVYEYFYRKILKTIARIFNSVRIYTSLGCCMLVDLIKLKQVNDFDERTFMYAEEYILGERIHTKKYKNYFCYDAIFFHDHLYAGKTANSHGDESLKYYLKSYMNLGPTIQSYALVPEKSPFYICWREAKRCFFHY